MKYKSKVTGLTTEEIVKLIPDEVDALFEQGRKWNLAPLLREGSALIFPHTLIRTVGDYTAAVVDAALSSNADHVIVLGVLHSLDRKHIIDARGKARRGEDLTNHPLRGIFGPSFAGDQTWRSEFSLENFCFLWNYAIRTRKISTPPELIIAYPCLSNNEPETLRGIERLKLKNSVYIATVDFCHHGKAYHKSVTPFIPVSKKAEDFAIQIINQGFELIAKGDYSGLIDYCYETVCDGTDVIPVLMHLLGPLKSRIIDLRIIDVVGLYENDPSPSWVAASLIEMRRFVL